MLSRLNRPASLVLLMVVILFAGNVAGDSNQGATHDEVITSVPRTMSYQGVLKDGSGDPVADSVYDVTFSIFDQESGGSSLWDETLPCTTSAGYFNTTFSNVNLSFDVDYWLELEVGGEILDPRQKMNMVGYAAVSDTADYAASGGGWVDDGLNVRLEASYDKVGIGTSTPTNKLHVTGSESVPILNVEQYGSHRAARFYSQNACALWVENAGNHGLRVTEANGDGVYIHHAGVDGIHVDSADGLAGYFKGGGYFRDNLGIGIESPSYKLDVHGTVGIDVDSFYADIPLTISVPSNHAGLISRISKGGSIINVVDGNGNVGIGTFAPTAKLDVFGDINGSSDLDIVGTGYFAGGINTYNISTGEFQMATGASLGYILTSDGSGNGTWQEAVAGDDSDWTVSGNDIYSGVPGNVGVGTSSPSYKLDLHGTMGIDVDSNFNDTPLTISVPSNHTGLISRIAKGGSIINVVDGNGNVGIGTSSPTAKLEVNGDILGNHDLDINGTGSFVGGINTYNISTSEFQMANGASSGYVLTSDGSGTGTWQAAAGGGGSGWTDDGSVVRLDTYSDSVGIGTASPIEKLHIVDTNTRALIQGGGNNAGIGVQFTGTGGRRYDIVSTGFGDGGAGRLKIKDVTGGNDRFTIDSNGNIFLGGESSTSLLAMGTGNVGIGDNNPQEKLVVSGTAQITGFKMATGASNGYVLTSDGSGTGTWQAAAGGLSGSGTAGYLSKFTGSTSLSNSMIYDSGSNIGIGTSSPTKKLTLSGGPGDIFGVDNAACFVAKNTTGTYERYLWPRAGDNSMYVLYGQGLYFRDNDASSSTTLFLSQAGDVGVGTASPLAKLDVSGTAQMTGFKMATGASNGYVLTSDGSGTGTWQAASGGGGGGWTDDGTVVRLDTYSDSIGIGTTSPTEKFHIVDTNTRALIQGGGNNVGIGMYFTGSGGRRYDIVSTGFGDGGAGRLKIKDVTGGNDRFTIDSNGNIFLGGESSTSLLAMGTGNVGIGDNNPQEKLVVSGTAQMTGFKMATGASSGYILTSDGSGAGTWQAPPAAINSNTESIDRIDATIRELTETIQSQNAKIAQLENRIAELEGTGR